ncbi:hypothetical protein ABIF66_001373 [Bradyrhizobium japonicum]
MNDTTAVTTGSNKITVLDAIMGSGKTTWAIDHINAAHIKNQSEVFDGLPGDRRVLYVAPFLTEVDRIRDACPDLMFRDPQPIHGRKLFHLEKLIEGGHNICTTHALFSMLNKRIYERLREQNYTLIIDEVITCVDLLKTLTSSDRKALFDGEYVIADEGDRLRWNHDKHPGYNGRYNDIKNLCDNGNLVVYGRDAKTSLPTVLIWEFPADFLRCFKDVFTLTYMFHGSPMLSYFQSEGLSFEMKSIQGGKLVEWGNTNEAAIKSKLRSLVTIYDGKMNDIGATSDRSNPLSSSWFDRAPEAVMKNLKSSTEMFFKRVAKTPSALNGWTTFKKAKQALKGGGYGRGFIPINAKATNDYIDKRSMAYLANVFHQPTIKGFFEQRGVPVYEDLHALSEMIQWVWRSGIRKEEPEPITVFVPSERMRGLLIECKRVFYRTGYARGWPRRRVTPGPSSVIGTAWLT